VGIVVSDGHLPHQPCPSITLHAGPSIKPRGNTRTMTAPTISQTASLRGFLAGLLPLAHLTSRPSAPAP